MHGFITRRSIVVFGGTTLLVSAILSTFFWLYASRLSMVPWHWAILGGLTAGALSVLTERRVHTTPPAPPVPQRRATLPIWQIASAWAATIILRRIFPQTITPSVQQGLVLGVSGLYFGLYYARRYLVSAGVELGSLTVRSLTLLAIQGLMGAIIALEVSLWLLGVVHLKAPCSALDLPRRQQGCIVAFDQASYAWESQISEDGSLLVTADAKGGIYIWSSRQRALVRRLEVPDQRAASLALSHDQQIVAVGFRDGTIRIWRIADGSLLHTITGHTGRINKLVFSADGQIVASASDDRTVRIWRLGADRPLQTLAHADDVSHLALVSSGTSLISASNDTIFVWDMQQGSVKQKLVLPDWIVSMAVSPDGQIIATGLNDQTVRLWRASQAEGHTLAQFQDRVNVLAFSPDGAQLFTSGGHGPDARIWRVADSALLHTIAMDGSIEAARFTSQHLLLVTNGLDTVFVWNKQPN